MFTLCAKRRFYAAANGLFGKLLKLASEEVILELVRTKCTLNFIVRVGEFSVRHGRPAFFRLHLYPPLYETF